MDGTGTPAGSPAEVEMSATGTATARYLWDPVRGVMLAAWVTGEASGDVAVVGMDLSMPIAVQVTQTIRLGG
jgi:hypothetical protein